MAAKVAESALKDLQEEGDRKIDLYTEA